MLRLTRGTDEIVSGLLIAFVAGPVTYAAIAIVSMLFMPDLVTIGVVLGLGLLAVGLLRALQGARHFLRNIETAALVGALGTDEVARRDKSHDW
ncbi:hypothetical protein [Demequina sp. NBRC 110054]|uniref:hypothetical protein n=1 Tax=Demequina sp. NBRC 110054 TaxID=1570343 RepID=UPI000A0390F6|nr:hypothetical protein [Demequina sp. NBRC 110054]